MGNYKVKEETESTKVVYDENNNYKNIFDEGSFENSDSSKMKHSIEKVEWGFDVLIHSLEEHGEIRENESKTKNITVVTYVGDELEFSLNMLKRSIDIMRDLTILYCDH